MNETATPTSSQNANRPKCRRGRGRTALFGALFLGVAAVLTAGGLQAFGFGPFRHGACGSMEPAQVDKKIDRIAGWFSFAASPEALTRGAELLFRGVPLLAGLVLLLLALRPWGELRPQPAVAAAS